MAEFDPYYKWLGIPVSEQPPNHYRLLGIELFESDPDVIQSAADRQMAYVVKCADGPQQKLSQRILNELSAARVCLLSPTKRGAYDAELRQCQGTPLQFFAAPEVTEFAFTAQEPEVPISRARQTSKSKKPPTLIFGIGGLASLIAVSVVWLCLPKSSTRPSHGGAKTEVTQKKSVSKESSVDVAVKEDKSSGKANAVQNTAPTPMVATTGEPSSDGSNEPDSMVAADETMPADLAPATPQGATTIAMRQSDAVPGVTAKSSTGKDKPETTAGNDKKTAAAPKAKAKASAAKKPNTKALEVAELELPTVGFDFALRRATEDGSDPDSTPAGQTKLAEISSRAATANKDCVAIDLECRPLLVERAALMVDFPAKQAAMLEAEANMKQLDGRIALIQDRPFRYSNDPLTMQEDKLREARDRFASEYDTNKNEVTNRISRFEAIGTSLQSLDERLKKQWEELNTCRKQWVDVCRPLDKYARGDFEGMQRVIDKWLVVDEVWTDAYCWGAVAAYELSDQQVAGYLLEKAEKLRVGILRSKRASSQIEATQGLVVLKIPGQRSKSPSLIQKAISHADKDGDWPTQFIAGRAMVEVGRQDSRAKAFLERAIKIEPNCQCATYWLGCLQTTSTEKTVRDVDTGIKLLESVWSYAGKQSWRVSAALARAYDAAERKSDAAKQWDTTLALAPESEHEQLKAQKGQ